MRGRSRVKPVRCEHALVGVELQDVMDHPGVCSSDLRKARVQRAGPVAGNPARNGW